ncbi:MAG: Gldg family protein [Phycisphaerales bacterium]
MSKPKIKAESTAGIRRTRYGAMTAILITAAAAIALFIGVIGERTATRFDLTATRSYTLSTRTTQLLEDLEMPVEVVVVVNLGREGSADPRSVERVRDLLSEYTQQSPNVSYSIIDTATAEARDEFQRVVGLMAGYAEDEIRTHRRTLERTISGLDRTEQDLRRLADRTEDTSQAASEFVGGQIEAFLINMRSMADEAAEARQVVQTALENEVAGTPLPASDQAQLAASQLLTNASSAFSDISAWAQQISEAPQIDSNTLKASAAALATAAGEAASQSAATLDRLIRLQPLEPLQVTRALQQTEAVLVIAPTGTTAIKFDAIFPLRTSIEQGQSIAQVSFAGEELISTAISTLSMQDPPIVVFVHAEPGRMFDDTGRPSAATSGDQSSPHARLGVSVNQLAQRCACAASMSPSGRSPSKRSGRRCSNSTPTAHARSSGSSSVNPPASALIHRKAARSPSVPSASARWRTPWTSFMRPAQTYSWPSSRRNCPPSATPPRSRTACRRSGSPSMPVAR